jgi:lysophospholipase L1-like esterase
MSGTGRNRRCLLVMVLLCLGSCQTTRAPHDTAADGGDSRAGANSAAPAVGARDAGSDMGGASAGGATGSGSGGAAGAGSGGAIVHGAGSGAGGNSARAGSGGRAGMLGAAGRSADSGVAGQPADAGQPRDASVDPSTLPSVTLYLAGDSTVMDYGTSSMQEGWGQELKQFLIGKVTIDNQAIGGRSIQSFMFDDAANTKPSSRWSTIQKNIRAGYYLMVQFGTNDSSGIAGRAVTPADFQMLLGTLIDAIKGKGATPILVTPSALQQWSSGKEGNSRLAPYCAAMTTIAPLKDVLVDDLNARSVELLNAVGQTAAMQIYIDGDKAHFTKSGATQMALIVAQELRRIGSPLAAYLQGVP